MKKKLLLTMIGVLLFLSLPSSNHADGNPVIKDRYSADPAAIVHDGKVYLYTGQDEATPNDNFFVLKKWSIYSSTDLNDWQYEGSLERTAFTWGMHDTAWASQAIERDGNFYWYTTVRNNSSVAPGYAIGVAVSDHPVHGWKDALGEPLVSSAMTDSPAGMGNDPWDVIDPTVFIDDDGQAYLYWGNTHLYYAKLKENMIELDGDIVQVEINNMPGTFTEGPYLHKYQDQYYMTYAMNYPEEIGYATSDSPEGPWEFGGKIMDRIPNSGTSHPAVLEFENEWYFIYHNTALPGGGEYNRSVAIERLHYYEDGSIAKITPTASGVSGSSSLIQPLNSDLALRQLANALRLAEVNEDSFDFRWYESSSLLETGDNYVSYQSENNPGIYLVRHENGLRLEKNDGSEEFAERATFHKTVGLADANAYSLQTYGDDMYIAIIHGNSIGLVSEADLVDPADATFTIEDGEEIIPPQPVTESLTDPVDEEEPQEEQTDNDDANQEEPVEITNDTEEEEENSLLLIVLILSALVVITIAFFVTKQNNAKPTKELNNKKDE